MEFSLNSKSKKEILDITGQINDLIAAEKFVEGSVLVFVKHTTAALTLSEVGEGTEEDLLEVAQKMIPQINFRHRHNPSHAPDHMIGSIIGQSLTIPIKSGRLDLGTWQRVVLIELNGPRELQLTLNFLK